MQSINQSINQSTLEDLKQDLISDLKSRVEERILEPENLALLSKLINQAETTKEAIEIAKLGTSYKRTGFHFDKKIEKLGNNIKYFKKNEELSFTQKDAKNTHKLIIGDNFDALQNLLITYKNKIDVIYIDPPYGKDDMGQFAETNYNNAITRDNLLSMLYPRLFLAKQLLSDEGVIFCSIDDKNQAYVKCLFDEIFGESNFVTNFVWKSTPGSNTGDDIKTVTEYVLTYCKYKSLFTAKNKKIEDEESYCLFDEYKERRGGYKTNKLDRRMTGKHYSESLNYAIPMPDGSALFPGGKSQRQDNWNWRWSEEKVKWGITNGFIDIKQTDIDHQWTVYFKQYLNVNNEDKLITRSLPHTNFLDFLEKTSSAQGTSENLSIFENKSFDYPKPINLIKYLISIFPQNRCLVLDFFAGSGTTGQSVLELNREDEGNRTFILCTNNEITNANPNGIALDVTSKRLKRVMTGSCYDGSSDFDWIKKNEPLGDNLDVYEIAEVSNSEQSSGKTPFDVIDETLYGQPSLLPDEKIEWVCKNFEHTQKYLVDAETK